MKLNNKGIAHVLLPMLVIVVVAAVGSYVLVKSKAATPAKSADSLPVVNLKFSASDGTWPTAVLDDPMSVNMGRYSSFYGYTGSKSYGPVLSATGTVSGIKTGRTATAHAMCGQTEPIPKYEYDTSSKQWGSADNGNLLMGLDYIELSNGANNIQLNVYGLPRIKDVDRTKPMICWAQVYSTSKSGQKLVTGVPVTQKFILQPSN